MTTKPIAPPAAATAAADAPDQQFTDQQLADKRFPEFPPRDDMNNSIYLHEPAWQPALRRHLSVAHAMMLLISEMPVAWSHDQRSGILVPDLLIAFDVEPGPIIRRRGYAIDDVRKPPDFVLEIASIHTARNDERGKRVAYALYGVTEYWRFDPTGGEFYVSGLAGDRLGADGRSYDPIQIHRLADGSLWGHSRVLNLDLCWEDGGLRWYDPAAQRYLDTYDEEADGRIEERVRRLLAEGEADAERAARILAEGQRDGEQAARLAAEAEAERLREVIRRLRQGQGK